ncbi:hypothetical protein BDV12DRAFT_141281 [Aspergillus spectabilis]
MRIAILREASIEVSIFRPHDSSQLMTRLRAKNGEANKNRKKCERAPIFPPLKIPTIHLTPQETNCNHDRFLIFFFFCFVFIILSFVFIRIIEESVDLERNHGYGRKWRSSSFRFFFLHGCTQYTGPLYVLPYY